MHEDEVNPIAATATIYAAPCVTVTYQFTVTVESIIIAISIALDVPLSYFSYRYTCSKKLWSAAASCMIRCEMRKTTLMFLEVDESL